VSAVAQLEPVPAVARIMERPGLAAVAGALTIAFSAILVKLADVSPSTAAIFRCAYALPVLGALALWEDRRFGPRDRRDRTLAAVAGVFFAGDLIFWHHAIADVGAGLATVLGNLQVVIIPFAAWALLGERIERRIAVALPLVCSGVVLISGALESAAYGENPARGVLFGFLTGLTYAGSSSCCAMAAPTCAARRGRCSTRRWSRRWWPSGPDWPSATRTSSRAGRRTPGWSPSR